MNYITVQDVMKKYKVTKTTIYNWIDSGLPSYKFGKLRRFIESEVDTWISERGSDK